MNIQPDFEEFLRLLEDHGVDCTENAAGKQGLSPLNQG
jgi:hypothetical protein